MTCRKLCQLVGKDSLSEDQKCTLEVARIIREDFLQQNGFSEYDFKCPLAKTIGMMRNIVGFHEAGQKAISESTGDQKVGWNTIYNSMRETVVKITQMKFELPGQSEEQFKEVFKKLNDEILTGFRTLAEEK